MGLTPLATVPDTTITSKHMVILGGLPQWRGRASKDFLSTGGLEGSHYPPLVGRYDWDKCIPWDTGLSMEAGQGGV